jgi:lysophospholipase L1-like esterase
MRRRQFWPQLLSAALILLVSCGDDQASKDNEGMPFVDNGVDMGNQSEGDMATTPDSDNPPTSGCATALIDGEAATISGRVYLDEDGSDRSTYAGGFDDSSDAPLADTTVVLRSEGAADETTSCEDGTYGFNEVSDGVHLVSLRSPGDVVCSQKNCPKRFPLAVDEGTVKIVTFGDSVPVQGASVMFPERLATLIGPLADVDNQNIAVGGTTSPEWLPGTPNFEDRLGPHIESADVIVVSIGGNDIMAYASDPANISNVDAAVVGAYELLDEVVANVTQMAAEIWKRNPNVDLVYCLYVDYSLASQDQLWRLVNGFLGQGTVTDLLDSARAKVGTDQGIILVDLFGASEGLPLDDYLSDSLHFNGRGQTFYAEEIFKTLGGVLVGESSPLSDSPRAPQGAVHDFGIAP